MSVACHYTNLTNAPHLLLNELNVDHILSKIRFNYRTLLIPQRIERRSHPYQKCALPIKLRNLK
jgi:hypothetical protein